MSSDFDVSDTSFIQKIAEIMKSYVKEKKYIEAKLFPTEIHL